MRVSIPPRPPMPRSRGRQVRVAAVALTLAALWATAWSLEHHGERRLVVGAGAESGDAFRFCTALAAVLEDQGAPLHLEVRATGGSRDNVRLLADGAIDLATVQADVPPARSGRLVARLFPDAYLLLTRTASDVHGVADLRGRRIALPSRRGGEFSSFWLLAEHFGLEASAVDAETFATPQQAFAALESGRVDALFRVRALQNPDLTRFLASADVRIVPIAQSAAMRLRHPALEAGAIPLGAFRGHPPLPERELSTVQVERLLLSRKNVDRRAVRELTRVLFEHRRDLLERTRLASFVRRPSSDDASGYLPVHPGARSFYDREQPHFLVENADFFALVLSLLVLLASGAFALKRRFDAGQKDLADHFTLRVMAIYRKARDARTQAEVEGCQSEMVATLADMVDHLDRDRVTTAGYAFFASTWQAVHSALRDLRRDLPGETPPDNAPR